MTTLSAETSGKYLRRTTKQNLSSLHFLFQIFEQSDWYELYVLW